MDEFGLKRPSLGTILGAIGAVMGFLGLIVSLSNSAGAAPKHATVFRGDIAPGAVTSTALATGAVHAKALAKGAVHPKALAKGSVHAKALAKGAVTSVALAADSVTSSALAPGSVYGGALGTETIHMTPIADVDAVAANPEWTAGNAEVASCAPGERLLGGGFVFSNPGNREASFLEMLPFTDNANANGVVGRIATNSGGSAKGEVAVVCLK